MKNTLIAVIVLIIVAIATYYLVFNKNSNQIQTAPNTAPSSSAQTSQNQPTSSSPASPASLAQSFTVHGNDNGADLTSITVNKGASVSITFSVLTEDTYHGGLDFRSSVVSTGPISPGSSKTVNFTAANSFAFNPYWPTTNIKKPYAINVTVK